MKILILSFYYEPDLGACSFRSAALVKSISEKLSVDDSIEIITTMPNRYRSLRNSAPHVEEKGNVNIFRISLPNLKFRFFDQTLAFIKYWIGVRKRIKNHHYDLIFATSGRFFSAFLGAVIAKNKKTPYYLDIRDILSDGISDVVKNKMAKFFLIPVIKSVEKFSISAATHLNLVSQGFDQSFNFYDGKTTFFTNGIDDTFLENNFEKETDLSSKKPKIITYAGNIGEGQGLEKIIPEAAKILRGKYIFNVIGDGNTKDKLKKKMDDLDSVNINLINPMKRDALIKYYRESDFLFLHLNNYDAFKKVLPSKIFEYGATKKPIIAGVDGYARSFLKEHLQDALIFEPSNVEEFIQVLESYQPHSISRDDFVKKFTRRVIFNEMTDTILALITSK